MRTRLRTAWSTIAIRMCVMAAAAMVIACSQEPTTGVPASETATLALGESFTPVGSTLHITFIGVPMDSRCPSDVVCVSAGNAQASFVGGVPAPGFGGHWEINTTTQPRELTVEGYVIRLEDVMPHPKSTAPIDTSAYRAVLTVRLAAVPR